MKRNAATEFAEAHIPGAMRFDIETIADQDHPMPHMVPSPDGFATAMRLALAMTTMLSFMMTLTSEPQRAAGG